MKKTKDDKHTAETLARRDKVSRACMDAALDLVGKQGYAALSIEAIAKITGIAKTTIYRRWRSKGELVLDALLGQGERAIKPTDSGSIQKDLESFVAQTFDIVTRHHLGSSLIAVMIEAQIDADFAHQLQSRLIEKRRQVLREIIERGKTSGELRADCDTEIVIDTIYGMFWYRLLLKHAPLDKELALTIIEQTLRGIEKQ